MFEVFGFSELPEQVYKMLDGLDLKDELSEKEMVEKITLSPEYKSFCGYDNPKEEDTLTRISVLTTAIKEKKNRK